MPRPDFFIIGAPKCGTTSLSEYLREHPGVFMCQPKEPFHFCTDLPGLAKYPSEAEYLELFKDADQDKVQIGEATAIYLYSSVACSRILEFNSSALMIAMLRNPVDLFQSYHSQQVIALNEDIADAEAAWELQAERAEGREVPKLCANPKLLAYKDIAKIGAQVERLLTICPRNQLKFILFEDFSADTKRVYADVLDFLSLSDDGRENFQRFNARSSYRSETVRVIRQIVAQVPWLERLILHGVDRTGMREVLKKVFRSPEQTPKLRPEFRSHLESVFADDVKILSELIGRDLSHWIKTET